MRRQPAYLSEIFPDLPSVPNSEVFPIARPHDYSREQPKLKPTKLFYEVLQDGKAIVVRSYDLLPTLTHRGFTFADARAVSQAAQRALLTGMGSYTANGLTIRRYEA